MSVDFKLLIVVPTYNEEENIEPLLKGIFENVPHASVLFVDDNSQDLTRDKISQAITKYENRIAILKRPGKMGLASAYIDGFKWGLERKFDWICEMDADLSHRAVDLKSVVAAKGDADVIIGSRYINGGGTINWSVFRQIISRVGSFYARTILGIKIQDLTGGFNLWSSKVLKNIGLESILCEGYSFQIELKYRANLAGYSLKESPIIFEERRAGASKMSGAIAFEAVYKVWILLFNRHVIKQQIILAQSSNG